MKALFEAVLLILILLGSTGLSIGLTYLPCYSTLCSEEFFPYETRLHIAFYYALLASIGAALLLRNLYPTVRKISETHIYSQEVSILKKRITIGAVAASVWIVSLTLATTAFWLDVKQFWGERTNPIGWVDGKIRLIVTCILGHHVDIVLGLVLIPVSRNSILGRLFDLHTSTLLYAHKLIAYLLVVGSAAHGAAYYAFVGTYRVQSDAVKELFEIDNPTLTQSEATQRGPWWFINLPSGMIAFVAMIVIVVTALPILRRRCYNTFYYLHVILSVLIFILLCFHASTNFYFLLPGFFLWIGDWTWRLFRGMSGLSTRVVGKLENAGNGWYRISLPVSAKLANLNDDVEAVITKKKAPVHPLQTYFLLFPKISRIQNHAFTAAKVESTDSGPIFLFQRSTGKKQKQLVREWTWKLGAWVDNSVTEAKEFDVRVEGPYIPSVPAMFIATNIICVVGGTGLTGVISIALWWLKHRSQVQDTNLTVVWTVRYKETAGVKEWRELEETVTDNPKIKLILQVTSEQGRVDLDQVLRTSSSAGLGAQQKEARTGSSCGEAWVYLSGPDSLLRAGETACVNLQREIRSGTSSVGLQRLDYYAAKWEV